jgi:hypothetical protein
MAFVDIVYQRDPATGFILFDGNGYPVQATNAGANTYGQLQARIADEVLGSPTATQIQQAIADAIATFEGMQFWFSDVRYYGSTGSSSNLQAVQGQEVYGGLDLPSLAGMPQIKNVQVIAFNNRYSLNPRTVKWIDDASVSQTWQGLPTDLANSGGVGFRLYPVPNANYPLILDATIRFPPLSADTDFNAWTNRAEGLIRQEAKRLLFTNITRNSAQADAMEGEVYGNPARGRQGQLNVLRRESAARAGGGGGRIRPSRGYF